jgi:DNA-binding LacI/PurR family transcriptional regulator
MGAGSRLSAGVGYAKDASAMTQTDLDQTLRAMAGSLPPGAILPGQRELCSRLRVSTFTLHRSLRQLDREGIITIVPRKGAYVRHPAATRRTLRLAYLDKPSVLRITDYGLSAFMSAVGRRNLELRVTHMDADDRQALRDFLNASAEDRDSFGVVISGYVDDATAEFLETVELPWAMLGDAHSDRVYDRLPIVTNDNFQGAHVAVESLLSDGCDALVLVNFRGAPDWAWVREARAGALAAAQSYPQTRVVLPEAPCLSRSDQFLREVREQAGGQPGAAVAVVCRCYYSMHFAAAVRQAFPSAAKFDAAVFDVDLPVRALPGFRLVNCSVADLAAATLRRIEARRRGADAPGRVRVPFQAVPEEAAHPVATG